MKTVCTKCGSDEIYVVRDKQVKEPETETLDEFVNNLHKPVNLVYKPITFACKKCGYSVTK